MNAAVSDIDNIPRHSMNLIDVMAHDMGYLAKNTTSIRTLRTLSNCFYYEVRMEVASNKHITMDIINKLSLDLNPFVLKNLMGNRSVPERIISSIKSRVFCGIYTYD